MSSKNFCLNNVNRKATINNEIFHYRISDHNLPRLVKFENFTLHEQVFQCFLPGVLSICISPRFKSIFLEIGRLSSRIPQLSMNLINSDDREARPAFLQHVADLFNVLARRRRKVELIICLGVSNMKTSRFLKKSSIVCCPVASWTRFFFCS